MISPRAEPVQHIEPLVTADWSNRNWEQEVRETSAALRAFPQIYESPRDLLPGLTPPNIWLPAKARKSARIAALPPSKSGHERAGRRRHAASTIFIPPMRRVPRICPASTPSKKAECHRQRVDGAACAPAAQDYTGPVLFEARAAAPLVAQILGPALNGARPAGGVYSR